MSIQADQEDFITDDANEIAKHFTTAYLELFKGKNYNLYDFKTGLMLFTGGIISSLLTTHFPDTELHEKIQAADNFCDEMRNICNQVLFEQSKSLIN